MRITISEPVSIAINQSLRDEGIDVLMEFLKSKVKIGIQVKSFNDVNQKDFTQSCIAQISRSHKHDICRMIMAIGSDATNASQKEKVRGLSSEISQMGNYCRVFPPEKTLKIWQAFEKKEHPITLIESTGDAILLIHELQKKLSQDPYYEHKISWVTTLKEKYDPSDNPVEFKLVVNQPAGSKNILDILKEIELTGESFTIPKENIEKFEVVKDGKVLISENQKISDLTIKPEKPKIVLNLETIDAIDGSIICFENLIFVVDSVVETIIYLSTHKNNLPYCFKFSFEKEKYLGDFSVSIDDHANVKQRYKLAKFLAALNSGKELLLKNSKGDQILRGQLNTNSNVLEKGTLELLKELSYIQEKKGLEIFPPKTLSSEELKKVNFIYKLLSTGKSEINSIKFPLKFANKSEAIGFLQKIKDEKVVKNCSLNDIPIEIELFGKIISLGLGSYQIPEVTVEEGIEKFEERVNQLGENEVTVTLRNAQHCLVSTKLYAF